jgi:diaminopimelate epimerase
MTLSLVKAHAYGNDFLLLPHPPSHLADAADLARHVCDRHRGVGADGLILVDRTPDGARTRLWNADGSQPEVSGNGTRCVGAWLVAQTSASAGARFTVDTEAGPKRLELTAIDGPRLTFRAEMGPPTELRRQRLDVGGESLDVVVLRVGNPQCVVLGPATAERLHRIGSALAVHPFFPHGTNVELVSVEAPDRVQILIWERGVGPTEASGTGACASAVAAAAFGGAQRAVDVISPGGTQRVEWTDETIWLTGWAEIVAEVDWFGA